MILWNDRSISFEFQDNRTKTLWRWIDYYPNGKKRRKS